MERYFIVENIWGIILRYIYRWEDLGKRKGITDTWKWNWSSAIAWWYLRKIVFSTDVGYDDIVRVGKCWARDWYDVKGYWSFSEYCRSKRIGIVHRFHEQFTLQYSFLYAPENYWTLSQHCTTSPYIFQKSIFSQSSIKNITFFSIFSDIR